MNIFPEFVVNLDTSVQGTTVTTSTIPREYAWDFINNDFKLKDGKFIIVTGKEALKVWIWKALHTLKMTYSIYSDNYGSNLDSIIGQGYSEALIDSEAKRLVEECLSPNAHILSIIDFKTISDGDTLNVSFTALTDQGEVIYSGL